MGRKYRALAVCMSSFGILSLAACGSASNPDFSLAVQTTAATVTPGSTATVTIGVSPLHKSQGSVTMILSGLPGDGNGGNSVGVAPAQATVGIGSTQTFYLVASRTAAPSTTVLTATATSSAVTLSSPITHTATLNLTVAPAPAP